MENPEEILNTASDQKAISGHVWDFLVINF